MKVALELWPTSLLVLAAFGLVPGFLLRIIVRVYPKGHPRRRELVAELYRIDYKKQPLFVAQQLELAISEGIPARWRMRRRRSLPGFQRLSTALSRLAEQEKAVLTLIYDERRTVAETATVLDISESQVLQVRRRAVLQLWSTAFRSPPAEARRLPRG